MISELAKLQEHHPESDVDHLIFTGNYAVRDSNGTSTTLRVLLFGRDHEGNVAAKIKEGENTVVIQFDKQDHSIKIFDENPSNDPAVYKFYFNGREPTRNERASVAGGYHRGGGTGPRTLLDSLQVTPENRQAIESHSGWILSAVGQALEDPKVSVRKAEFSHLAPLKQFCRDLVTRVAQTPA